jgi:uncharacterized protein (TIGR03435 family)
MSRCGRCRFIYNLVLAKDGPKIKPFDPEHPGQRPARVPGASMLVGGFEIPQIAKALAGTAGRPVIDKTGLQGRYFFAIQYSQLGTNTETDGAPDIFGAVQQQLNALPRRTDMPGRGYLKLGPSGSRWQAGYPSKRC